MLGGTDFYIMIIRNYIYLLLATVPVFNSALTIGTETNGKTYLLTGDIGGTNSRMRLYDTCNPKHLAQKDYRNHEVFKKGGRTEGTFERFTFDPILEHCWTTLNLKDSHPIEKCEIISVFVVAGPVEGNKATLTNLGITIDGDAIERVSENVYEQNQASLDHK